MKIRPIVTINEELCDGCGACLPSCAEGALYLKDGKVHILEDRLCDGLGACLGNCPKGALSVEERLAPDFVAPCPSMKIFNGQMPNGQMFGETQPSAHGSSEEREGASALSAGNGASAAGNKIASAPEHLGRRFAWPLKLSLLTPQTVGDRNTLVLIADCASFVSQPLFLPALSEKTAPALLCPKLENKQALVAKLAEILQNGAVQEIHAFCMEVPCCGLPALVEQAQKLAGVQLPVKTTVCSLSGEEKHLLNTLSVG